MKSKDWTDLGGNLNRIIEDAVRVGDFGRLNENINRTIKNAFGAAGGEEFRKGDGWDFNLSGNNSCAGSDPDTGSNSGSSTDFSSDSEPETGRGTQAESYNYGKPGSGYQNGTSYQTWTSYQTGNSYQTGKVHREQTSGYASRNAGVPVQNLRNKALFAGSGKRQVGSAVMLAGGILVAAVSFPSFVSVVISMLFYFSGADAGAAIMLLIMLAAGILLIVKGAGGLGLSKRFDMYVRCLAGRDYADIDKMTGYCRRQEKEIVKDLRKMIAKRWFLQGHLDRSESCLMVTHEVYEQYLAAEKNNVIREAEEERKREEEMQRTGTLSPEVKAILQKGKEYIESIRKSNDAIPGEEVSEKIYKIELLVRKIFQQTEAHPENAKDLRKLMDYYLPMTVKLLNAYEELDAQPIQGENIINSKKEIEDTLDTLNFAYAKMLDNLFEDTAWDVSSDISVLQTMLAQEGLTDDGFKSKPGEEKSGLN